MCHFINNAQGGKTAEWMKEFHWKLCQLQLKTWGSSTSVRYFPSVCPFELTSVRQGFCRRLGYCDSWRSKIVHQDWNFTWQKPDRNSQCFALSLWWGDSGQKCSFTLGYSFSWRTCRHNWWPKVRKVENINRWTQDRRATCEEVS
jgi:hypothetical protein